MLCILSTLCANALSIFREHTSIPRNSINRFFFVVDIPCFYCELQIEYLEVKEK